LPTASPGQEGVQEDLLFLKTDVKSYKDFRYGFLLHKPRLSLMGIILSGTPPIRDFNRRFHREPENKTESAFVPLPPDYDLDTLLIAKHAYKTRQRGLFLVSALHFPHNQRQAAGQEKHHLPVQRKNRLQGILRQDLLPC